MKIRNLRTNHLENPLGYLMKSPMLTWTAEDSTGTVQRGARVQVASDEAFQDILYDSGMRGDISALGFVPDLALAPAHALLVAGRSGRRRWRPRAQRGGLV